jgi:putative transposase
MPRPPRLQFPYGVYHLTSRGVDGRFVFMDEGDRHLFLVYLCRVVQAFEWTLHVYCQMGNHFHLIAECGQPGLSRGMQRLNGAYATAFNARYRRDGHLFQSRFEAWAIEDDEYFEEAVQYVRNNPVRAGLCSRADLWPWSGDQARLDRYRRTGQPPTTTRRVRSGARPSPVTSS